MCEGPFIWYPCPYGAVLHCARCGHITVTGNIYEYKHAQTPIIKEAPR
jgi:hypothetical protein